MGNTAVYESEAQRLQREADSFTKRFEHEKKRLLILTGQVEQAEKELIDKKTKGVLGVEDPNVRKLLGIPLEGCDMKTRTYRFEKLPPLKQGQKDRISQSIQKDQIEQVMIKRDTHQIKLKENQVDKMNVEFNKLRSGNQTLKK